MSTLFSAVDSAGTTRRCDAVCHNALGVRCHCICGGVLHGPNRFRMQEYRMSLERMVEHLIERGFSEVKVRVWSRPGKGRMQAISMPIGDQLQLLPWGG